MSNVTVTLSNIGKFIGNFGVRRELHYSFSMGHLQVLYISDLGKVCFTTCMCIANINSFLILCVIVIFGAADSYIFSFNLISFTNVKEMRFVVGT